VGAFLRVPLLLGLLAVVLALIPALAYVDRFANLGVTWGAEQTPIAGTGINPLGVNVFLEKEADPEAVRRTLRVARDAGFHWIRQGFVWSDIEIAGKGDYVDRRGPGPAHSAWDKYDFIVDQARAFNLEIVARLDATPAWARSAPNPNNPCGGDQVDYSHAPPANVDDYADFVKAVVSRYKGKVRYFQIWNEPNLIGEWPPQPNPAAYTALLKAAYEAAHAANPDAVILMAPLAQTHTGDQCNPNDILYLQAMYDAGAQPYFDIANVMDYGLNYSPADRRTDLDRINFSRPVLARDVMVRNGDGAKGIWASEYGWVSLPPDWGADPANKPGIWGSVTPEQQANYLVSGYDRARAEWPWMGAMFVWFLRDPAPLPHEPQAYFAILNQDWTQRPAYGAIARYSKRFPLAETGAGLPDNPALTVAGPWTRAAPADRPVYTATTPNSTATLTFEGNILDLVFAPGAHPAPLQVELDGAPPPGWPVDSTGRALATIPAAGTTANRVTPDPAWPAPPGLSAVRLRVAGDLKDTRHTVTIRPANVDAPVALLGFVVGRESPQAGLFAAGYLLLTGLALWLGVRSTFAIVALPRLVRQAVALPGLTGDGARAGVVVAAMTTALVTYYLLPSPRWALLPLIVWFLLAVLRPDMAVVTTAAAIPFATAPRALLDWSFPISETCLWLTLIAWIIHRAWREQTRRRAAAAAVAAPADLTVTGYLNLYQELQGPVPWRERLRTALRRDLFGVPAGALLIVGTFSLLTVANPEYLRDSLRAYRWVIVEPVLFYFLATDIRAGRRQTLRVADGFIGGSALAAALALALGFLNVPGHTLDVQGVVRFQGLFTHPDNLGLFLGRALAFTAALAWFLTEPGETLRRRAYILATLVMIPALVLSYSRGAWLAVVVAVGVSLWMVGGRAARVFTGALVAGGAGLLALAALGRLPERILHTGSGLIRLDLWQTALAMLRDHPVFGIGLDQFLNQYQGPYADPAHQQERWLSHPHNLLLDCWLSLGIIGVLVAGWIMVRVILGALALIRRTDARGAALARAVLAGMTVVVVHGLVDNSYFLPDLALTFWLFCALLQMMWKPAHGPPFAPATGNQ
jgi:O-antigen ligase